MSSNVDKTKYITTLSSAPSLSPSLPAHWQPVKETERYKYLGVLIGRDVDVNEVFMEAWKKFSKRASSYMPLKSYFNTQPRVIIANSFLSPIFSYLFRFYLMGEDFQKDVEKVLTRWLVPASRFRHDNLTACTADAGLTQPLHDIRLVNIAALLRNQPPHALPDPSDAQPRYYHGDGASLLHSEHIQRATFFFHDIADDDPPPKLASESLSKLYIARTSPP